MSRETDRRAVWWGAMSASLVASLVAAFILIVPQWYATEFLRRRTQPVSPSQTALAPTASAPYEDPDAPVASPGPAPRSVAAFAALQAFSHPGEIAWGGITMSTPQHTIEQVAGALQCRPQDHRGFYCACEGQSGGVEFLIDFRSRQTGDDADVCRRADVRPATLAVLLTQAEQSLSHNEIISMLGERLPAFRRVRGPEPPSGEERSHFKPVYTYGDGAYNLIVDYEWTAIRIVHSSTD